MKTHQQHRAAAPRRAIRLTAGSALILTAVMLALSGHPGGEEKPPIVRTPDKSAEQSTPLLATSGSVAAAAKTEAAATAASPEVMRALAAIAAEFRQLAEDKSLTTEARQARARDILRRLREALRNLPADQAAAAIVAFLHSGADAATGLGFTLESGGVLADAPSLRTALLDLLGQFDPGAAAEYAQTVFNQSQVAAEWALALRTLGWQNQDGSNTAELRTRLSELLDHDAWAASAPDGFFDAFDVAAHLAGTSEFTSMASVMRLEDANGNPVENGSTHAAYLALDRITTSHPDQSLTQLADDPALLSWAPEHRASLMARADVSSPAQRAAVERYLASLPSYPEELETFTAMFPNRNGLMGNALITTQLPDTGYETLLNGDRAALAAVNGWLADGRFAGIEPGLRRISQRLTGFLADANTAGSQ